MHPKGRTETGQPEMDAVDELPITYKGGSTRRATRGH